MALLDSAIGARTAVLDIGSGFDDIAGGDALLVTGTPQYLDPICSGTATAAYLSSDTIAVDVVAFDSRLETTVSSYLHFQDVTGTLVSFDGTDIAQTTFLEYNSDGYVTVTLPYVGFPQVSVNYVPVDTTQIVVAMSTTEYTIYINGWQYASGAGGTFANVEQLIYGGTAAMALGAALVYDRKLGVEDVEREVINAVAANSTASVYSSDNSSFSDSNQVFANKFDVPRSYDWAEFDSTNMSVRNGLYGLDLRQVEAYDESRNAYYIENISEYSNGASGQIYVYIPSYQSSATVRGAVYLKRLPGQPVDEHIIIFDSNAVKYVHREFTVVSGEETYVDTTSASLGTATGAVSVGFEWDATSLSVRLNNSATVVQTSYDFSPYEVQALFGTDNNDNAYYSSQDQWDWHIRLSETPEVSPGLTTYGSHSYDTGSGEALPVSAEGSVTVVVPHPDATIRNPYYEIDGKHSITEVLD